MAREREGTQSRWHTPNLASSPPGTAFQLPSSMQPAVPGAPRIEAARTACSQQPLWRAVHPQASHRGAGLEDEHGRALRQAEQARQQGGGTRLSHRTVLAEG